MSVVTAVKRELVSQTALAERAVDMGGRWGRVPAARAQPFARLVTRPGACDV